MRRFLAVCAGVWLGVHIAFGYIAAPILFSRLDKITAGNIAGSLFAYANWFGLIVWWALFFVCRNDCQRNPYAPRKTHFWIMLLLILNMINEFLIAPVIAALKTGTNHWLHQLIGGSFGMWHGVSSLVYLAVAVIGLCLCCALLRLRDTARY